MKTLIGCETCLYGYLSIDGAGYYCKQPEHKKIECVKNKLAHYVAQLETTVKSCENCAYLGTREDSSKFCVILGKELSDTACDLYNSAETAIIEHTERTKLIEAVQFIHTYCTNHPNCTGCPFDGGIAERCELVQIPSDWDTDCLM